MEIFEMRYFFEAAVQENLHRASEKLHVSPASLSKAVARIEEELGVKLFAKEGRNIHLTGEGRLLKQRVSQILQLEESARLEVSGHLRAVRVLIAGPEVLLSKFGFETFAQIARRHPRALAEYLPCDERAALTRVAEGEAHLAVVTEEIPSPLHGKVLGESKFQTVVGKGHPLHGAAKAHRPGGIEEILSHPFVGSNQAILGRVGPKQSSDGWRDDQFPRKFSHRTTSLKLLERLVCDGQGIAYLPDYYAETLEVLPLKVTGCPYTCLQKIRLVARRPREIAWLNQLF